MSSKHFVSHQHTSSAVSVIVSRSTFHLFFDRFIHKSPFGHNGGIRASSHSKVSNREEKRPTLALFEAAAANCWPFATNDNNRSRPLELTNNVIEVTKSCVYLDFPLLSKTILKCFPCLSYYCARCLVAFAQSGMNDRFGKPIIHTNIPCLNC